MVQGEKRKSVHRETVSGHGKLPRPMAMSTKTHRIGKESAFLRTEKFKRGKRQAPL